MKISPILFAPLLVSAAPGVTRRGHDRVVEKRAATITTTELADLRFFSQYAAAANCNGQVAAGSAIACANNGCPDVEAVGSTVVDTFGGVVTDIHGYVATDVENKLIVVAYKGSTSLRNYLADFVFHRVGCADIVDGCEVHAGFSKANDETWEKMLATLTTTVAANPTYKVVFTGHSLGGAVATLATARARKLGFSIDLYNYGSPRVGNQAFAEFVTSQPGVEYRITHLTDPVPRLPPIFLGYHHISPEYWLSNGIANTTDYSPADIKICEGTASVQCNAGGLGFDPDAHNYYLGHITACTGPFDFKKKRDAQGEVEFVSETAVPPLHITPDLATIDPPVLSDEELIAQMLAFAEQDIDAANALA
ncbi:lipase [Microdochium trichocladiopsis]|uniref:Lipase n=1 Tax=Microdochium trichocladiopsis TaxID=1682393 RepID=A0A9P8Y985_9PEZI|nr:lipase [Microdochium trichocladiopsis]KAH7033437.1 lipase [Microdochium trichocladiopsis]